MDESGSFDLLSLCNKKDRPHGIILGASKIYRISDNRVLAPYAPDGFFPLSRLIDLRPLHRKRVSNSINAFVVNNSCGVVVKLPKKLTINLCKIAGAIIADGHISKTRTQNKNGYIIELDDKDKIAVQKFSAWFFEEFGYKLKVTKNKKFEMWSIDVNNKIIGRFLHKVLGIPLGEKSSWVDMPHLIKTASQEYQEAFWLGVLTFDCSVNASGTIELLLRSKPLIKSFTKFSRRKKIAITTHTHPDKNGFWRIHSSKPSPENLKKWIRLFEKNTCAWKRLHYALNPFDNVPLNEAEAIYALGVLYPGANTNKIFIRDIFYKIKTLKEVTNQELAHLLGIDTDTLRKYRNILYKANIISVKSQNRVGDKMFIEYNREINTWKVPRVD
jgi:hypothetical protein